jgi:putative membrane protein
MTLLLTVGLIVLADANAETLPPPSTGFFPDTFWPGVVGALIYGVVGIALVVLGFKVFDWLTPRIHIQTELAEKHNVAVAILCAAVILGICYVVAQAIH